LDNNSLVPHFANSVNLLKNILTNNFHSCAVHLDTIKVFYLSTDAQ